MFVFYCEGNFSPGGILHKSSAYVAFRFVCSDTLMNHDIREGNMFMMSLRTALYINKVSYSFHYFVFCTLSELTFLRIMRK